MPLAAVDIRFRDSFAWTEHRLRGLRCSLGQERHDRLMGDMPIGCGAFGAATFVLLTVTFVGLALPVSVHAIDPQIARSPRVAALILLAQAMVIMGVIGIKGEDWLEDVRIIQYSCSRSWLPSSADGSSFSQSLASWEQDE